ncbi:MAG: MepB family protein [Marinoscillum sp.]
MSHQILKIYEEFGFDLKNYQQESESKAYHACSFDLNGVPVISRKAKITPTKSGQFVTFWKRNANGPITPYEASDSFALLLVNVENGNQVGQFVFPKSELIKRGIISTPDREGKRAFRIYPPWSAVSSRQANASQKWQTRYFIDLSTGLNKELLKKRYSAIR